MLVIRSLPDIYEKFKTRWIEQENLNKDIKKTSLWNRLNNDGLTPLTLAADLRRTQMFTWLLEERKKIQWSYGDISCVIHPLDQLDFGLTDHESEQPLSVLEVIIKNNDSELVHPIITSLIDKKWKHFVHRVLIRRFLIAFIYLIIFLITTILEQTRSNLVLTDEQQSDFLSRVFCEIGHVIVVAGAILKSGREINEMSTMGLRKYLGTTVKIYF